MQTHIGLSSNLQSQSINLRSWAQFLLQLFQKNELTVRLVSIQTPVHRCVSSNNNSIPLSLSFTPWTSIHTFKLIF